jgi:hypothetical protein
MTDVQTNALTILTDAAQRYECEFMAPLLARVRELEKHLITQFIAELEHDRSRANFEEFSRNLRLLHHTRVGLENLRRTVANDPRMGF